MALGRKAGWHANQYVCEPNVILQILVKAHFLPCVVLVSLDTEISPLKGFLSSWGRQIRKKVNSTEGHMSAMCRERTVTQRKGMQKNY